MKLAHDECDDHPVGVATSFPHQLTLDLKVVVAMSAPCPACGSTDGELVAGVGTSSVLCGNCGRFCINVADCSAGRPLGRRRARPWISPRHTVQIFIRDKCACFWCKRSDVSLHIGHMVSVCDGRALGLSDAELFCSENLAVMCKVCNSGMGRETMPVWLWAAAVRARTTFVNTRLRHPVDVPRRPRTAAA